MTADAASKPPIDPTIKALLEALSLEFTLDDGIEVARDKFRAAVPPAELLPAMRIEERTVGYGDDTDVPVRIYWPPVDQHEDLPVVVYFHGGGWSICDLDTHDHVARAHAVGAEAIVVSVDYRLAPEHPFPAGVEDAWAALRWVAEHAAELGGDPARIAVAGDSAGGNLAAVVALLARDHGGPALAFQLLWYPIVVGDTSLPSFRENADARLLNAAMIAAFLAWYLPGADLSDPSAQPATLAPANADSLAGLPSAYIGTADHDPLRDDGARYAELLRAAGVPVELVNEAGLTHGYASLAFAVPVAAAATDRGLSALRRALHPG